MIIKESDVEMHMRVFKTIGGYVPLFKRDIEAEQRELATTQSICKQLLEEINHARRGHEHEHLEHVLHELDTLIATLRNAKSAADHAHDSWKRFVKPLRGQTRWADELVRASGHEEKIYLTFLGRVNTRLREGEYAYGELTHLLTILRDYTQTMHESLLEAIRTFETDAYIRAAYHPPHHSKPHQ